MTVDVAAFTGDYPYRALPDSTPEALLREMDRLEIAEAWVGHLPAFLYKDPAAANRRLDAVVAPHRERLRPIATLHPGLPGWERDLAEVGDAPAVRLYPLHQSVDPSGVEMTGCVRAAAERGLAVVLTVRFEDVRQRHPLDTVGDLPAAAVRALARVGNGVRLLVTHAGRGFIEEVHFGLTPAEAKRILWDISWIWGPPEDDLASLLHTVGVERFTFGTGFPLRLPDAAVAKLDLLALSPGDRTAIERDNLSGWRAT